MNVGWIGLGSVGAPMALRVRAGGHDVVGHVRSLGRHPELADEGLRLTTSVIETVVHADLVCVNVFDDAQLTDALIDKGALAAMRPGAVLVIHSTGHPSAIEAVARQAPPGVGVLDATFSGTSAMALEGRITLLVGGDADHLEHARPVISSYCNVILPIGPVGAARRVKLLNNMLHAAQTSLAVEAIQAAEQMGVNRQTAVQAFARCSGASFAMSRFAGERTIEEILAKAGRYTEKDTRLARWLARETGVDLPLMTHATAQWDAGAAQESQ